MAQIYKEKNYMGLPMNIARGNPLPLDTTAVWYDRAAMEAYAKNGDTAYVGQILTLVLEEDQTVVETYVIQNMAGDLGQVGGLITWTDHLQPKEIIEEEE